MQYHLSKKLLCVSLIASISLSACDNVVGRSPATQSVGNGVLQQRSKLTVNSQSATNTSATFVRNIFSDNDMLIYNLPKFPQRFVSLTKEHGLRIWDNATSAPIPDMVEDWQKFKDFMLSHNQDFKPYANNSNDYSLDNELSSYYDSQSNHLFWANFNANNVVNLWVMDLNNFDNPIIYKSLKPDLHIDGIKNVFLEYDANEAQKLVIKLKYEHNQIDPDGNNLPSIVTNEFRVPLLLNNKLLNDSANTDILPVNNYIISKSQYNYTGIPSQQIKEFIKLNTGGEVGRKVDEHGIKINWGDILTFAGVTTIAAILLHKFVVKAKQQEHLFTDKEIKTVTENSNKITKISEFIAEEETNNMEKTEVLSGENLEEGKKVQKELQELIDSGYRNGMMMDKVRSEGLYGKYHTKLKSLVLGTDYSDQIGVNVKPYFDTAFASKFNISGTLFDTPPGNFVLYVNEKMLLTTKNYYLDYFNTLKVEEIKNTELKSWARSVKELLNDPNKAIDKKKLEYYKKLLKNIEFNKGNNDLFEYYKDNNQDGDLYTLILDFLGGVQDLSKKDSIFVEQTQDAFINDLIRRMSVQYSSVYNDFNLTHMLALITNKDISIQFKDKFITSQELAKILFEKVLDGDSKLDPAKSGFVFSALDAINSTLDETTGERKYRYPDGYSNEKSYNNIAQNNANPVVETSPNPDARGNRIRVLKSIGGGVVFGGVATGLNYIIVPDGCGNFWCQPVFAISNSESSNVNTNITNAKTEKIQESVTNVLSDVVLFDVPYTSKNGNKIMHVAQKFSGTCDEILETIGNNTTQIHAELNKVKYFLSDVNNNICPSDISLE